MVDDLNRSPGREARDMRVLELAGHRVQLARPACLDLQQADVALGRHHGVPWAVGLGRDVRDEAAEDVVV
eukprot:2125999-Alexandrium_andersonii.AAC.1